MLSLGIWAFGRDSSAVLVDETSIVAAIEEEKLSRFAGTGGIPRVAVARCLEQAGATIQDVQMAAFPLRPRISAFREAGPPLAAEFFRRRSHRLGSIARPGLPAGWATPPNASSLWRLRFFSLS